MTTNYGERPGMVERSGDGGYSRLSRLVRRAEGAARWARFWRKGAEESRALGRKLGAVLPSEAARTERAERAGARAAHLRQLASEAVNCPPNGGNLSGRA